MRPTFMQMLRDETLRAELGPEVVAGLATENLVLSTPDLSAAVRSVVISGRG